jgi:hypothetical protein
VKIRMRRGTEAVGAIVLFLVVSGVVAVAQLAEHLLPLVLLGGAGCGGWRLWQRLGTRARSGSPGRGRRVVPGTVLSPGAVRLAEAEAENAELLARDGDLRRQVAKLEDDAARHDDLIERIERVTRRPVELHVADLERAQRVYGPAVTGKTGGRP